MENVLGSCCFNRYNIQILKLDCNCLNHRSLFSPATWAAQLLLSQCLPTWQSFQKGSSFWVRHFLSNDFVYFKTTAFMAPLPCGCCSWIRWLRHLHSRFQGSKGSSKFVLSSVSLKNLNESQWDLLSLSKLASVSICESKYKSKSILCLIKKWTIHK